MLANARFAIKSLARQARFANSKLMVGFPANQHHAEVALFQVSKEPIASPDSGSEIDSGTDRAKLCRAHAAAKRVQVKLPPWSEWKMDEIVDIDLSDTFWFAVWTRSRQEKVAASMLETSGVQHFLPLKSEVRQWSDRKQTVTVPLFSGYLFVRMNPTKDSRLQVLKTPGIAGFVGNNTGPLPIPDQQIEYIRTVLAQRVECMVLPLLEEGDRVRVVRGPLTGVEGRLLQSNSTLRLLISIEMIRKTLAVRVLRQDVELISRQAA